MSVGTDTDSNEYLNSFICFSEYLFFFYFLNYIALYAGHYE